jgi:hypothetical protein
MSIICVAPKILFYYPEKQIEKPFGFLTLGEVETQNIASLQNSPFLWCPKQTVKN